ncbi:MAG: chemotaxis protein [Pseudooceanicola sp.]|jgi:methyl-accepting chemotaxis protein|nr:chemotaxis protein [Pseudooceanicola sp.]
MTNEYTREAKWLATGAWAGPVASAAAAWFTGANIAVVAGVAAVFALAGTVAQRLSPAVARTGAAQALTAQAVVLNAAFAGHPWQIDTHMLYFALLAVTTILYDIRAILGATLVVAVHHLSLTFIMPSLVFPSASIAENIPRTALHAVILVMETAALVYAVYYQKQLAAQMNLQNADLERSSAQAEQSRKNVEAALREAEAAQTASAKSEARAQEALTKAEEQAKRAAALEREGRESSERELRQREEIAERQRAAVDALRESLKALRNNDLCANINARLDPEYDGLKADFNAATEGLRMTLAAVRQAADVIGTEANALAAASGDMSRRTESQASTLAEISSNMSSLTDRVRETAQSARDAQTEADDTRQEVAASAELVQRAVVAMGAIETSSNQIQKIVGVIDEISFQTNLLALNAGVEAARAGESGRGFAVVASEVRNLAMRSSEAAQEIKTLIAESDVRVAEGVGLVRQSGDVNSTITSAVNGIVQRVVEIATNAEKQSSSVADINGALSKLDSVTQKSAAMFEETAAASETLLNGTRELHSAIMNFRIDAETSGSVPRASAA